MYGFLEGGRWEENKMEETEKVSAKFERELSYIFKKMKIFPGNQKITRE